MLRKLVLTAVTTVVVPLGAMLAPGAVTGAQAATCTDGVAVSQFAFSPSSVPAGQKSTLTLLLTNCTNQTIQGLTTWFGHFTSSASTDPAPDCPVIDPISFGYTIAPGGTYTRSEQDGDTWPGCLATGLQMNVSVNVNNVVSTVTTATANLAIQQPTSPPPTSPPPTSPPPGGSCHVSYTPSDWQGGFTANVTISDTGTVPVNGWTLAFTFPGDQKITNAWNATVSQSGESVTATNVGYNASIPVGGSQSFGFQGTWTSSDASPTSFSVNGVACS